MGSGWVQRPAINKHKNDAKQIDNTKLCDSEKMSFQLQNNFNDLFYNNKEFTQGPFQRFRSFPGKEKIVILISQLKYSGRTNVFVTYQMVSSVPELIFKLNVLFVLETSPCVETLSFENNWVDII